MQVLEERIFHIPYVPVAPEPLNEPTGNELKPRPVGEENGIVVFNYNPISAVNYVSVQHFRWLLLVYSALCLMLILLSFPLLLIKKNTHQLIVSILELLYVMCY